MKSLVVKRGYVSAGLQVRSPQTHLSPTQKHELALRLYLPSTTTVMSIALSYTHTHTHCWAQVTCKKKKTQKDIYSYGSGKATLSDSLFLSFQTFTVAVGWWNIFASLTLRVSEGLWASASPPNEGGPGYRSDTASLLWAAATSNVLGQFTGEKTASVYLCSHPRSDWFFFCLCTSHDCLPLLLHQRGGFLVLAGSRGRGTLLVWNMELLCRRRCRVFWDGTVLHVPGEVAVTVDGYRSKSGGEMEGQRASGGDVGDAGVWHHRSVAVSVAAAPSFPFKVQVQGSPAPGLFDLSLHLRKNSLGF